tara:strand:- start:177 stop:338 length:162 start_codon:yes stop_codon:yes gene_type:complete
MATWNMTKENKAATGQKITYLADTSNDSKIKKLEEKVLEQDKKLDKILKLLRD